MRSRLEARYAAHLDARGVSWQYEPFCYADERGQYLPDFLVNTATFVEVKPYLTPELVVDVARKMDIIRSTVRDANLCIWSPDNAVILYKGDWWDRHDRIYVNAYDWEQGEAWKYAPDDPERPF
jgi:hypothetical protein